MTNQEAKTPPVFQPKDHWATLKERMEKEGPVAVSKCIEAFEDGSQIRQLYSFAMRTFDGQDWLGKNFDQEIELARLGIEHCLQASKTEEKVEVQKRLLDSANIMSYNLSANLADCWPGDERKRETRHFEEGLRAAEDCLRWRGELEKGPGPFAMAHWARGMHLISLGRPAIDDMRKALDFEIARLKDDGQCVEFSEKSSWSLLLYQAYLGLAEKYSGQVSDRASKAREYLGELAKDKEKEGDAKFCLDQLSVVAQKYGQ